MRNQIAAIKKSHSNRIAEVKNDVKNHSNKIAEVKNDVKSHSNKIAEVKNDICTLKVRGK